MNLSQQDLAQLEAKGISVETLESQLRRFRTGFPCLKVQAPATPGSGILVLTDRERLKYMADWERFLRDGGTVIKMVPASGAASRMFKALFGFLADGQITPFIGKFVEGIHKFAFAGELDKTCRRLYNKGIDELVDEGKFRDLVAALISPEGMNYGAMPKALLLFHSYADGSRTALEEQLAEGAEYAADEQGQVRVHFTVSPEHEELFERRLNEVMPELSRRTGKTFIVDRSIQSPATDTVAVLPDGTPYREDGRLFFRPAGHGALIGNLSALAQEVVFLKNIDNVVPDSKRALSNEYKKVLGGLLVDTRHKIEHYAGLLTCGLPSRPVLNEILDFMRDTLFITNDGAEDLDDLELADYLLCKLNRPLRVCGMVRNEGEPGGGPFLTVNPDGTVSPQILEAQQLDPANPDTGRLLKESTHFNPVDLVCFTRDLEDEPFDLLEYVDENTGMISQKSRKGVEIQALELPGLWNGSMSDWNTIFVEIPAETFNPVKTVNDLLRPAHQG